MLQSAPVEQLATQQMTDQSQSRLDQDCDCPGVGVVGTCAAARQGQHLGLIFSLLSFYLRMEAGI